MSKSMKMNSSPEYKKQVLSVVEGSLSLAGQLSERQILDKLGQQISRIISASKIEGNEEVASFAMLMNNVVLALASGRLVLDGDDDNNNNNIRSLLKESFLEIKRN